MIVIFISYWYTKGLSLSSIQKIIRNCDNLEEISLADTMLSPDSINFVAKNLTTKIEKLNLSGLEINDEHMEALVNKCKKIRGHP